MARYDDMVSPPGMDDDESDDEICGSGAQHKAKPRRKSHQRPQGSDQIRQAFSKRKKGLVLKAYQLSALTDAKVFMFIVNDKGTSWAYATPGFSNSLNADLLKQLRTLAHVPEQAKLITEVMPDPPNVKQPIDTAAAAAAELAALRRGDQVPGYEAPCTRTATGAIPARSRSSYSGGDGTAAGASCDRVPLTRSGSTTATRTQSLVQGWLVSCSAMQSEDHSPTKPRARPLSGSSMAGGVRPGSALAQSQLQHQQQQQQQRQMGGKLLGMEPPTPCGMYNLLGQPVAVNDSPTVVSEMATSCASPGSKQHMLPPDVAAGVRLAAAVNTAAACGMPIAISQGMEQQQEGWQRQTNSMHWLPQQPQEQPPTGSWQVGMYQQQLQQQQYQPAAVLAAGSADGWVAVEVNSQQCFAGNEFGADCQLMRMCSATNSTAQAPGSNAAAVDGASGGMWNPAMQQAATAGGFVPDSMQQQVLSNSAPGSFIGAAAAGRGGDAAGHACFESMLRGLPPLRVGQQHQGIDWREPDGAHSAPAGAVNTSALGRPSQWMEFEVKPENLRQMSDAGCYASSSGYSSYGPSLSCADPQQARTNASSPVDGQGPCNAAATSSGPPSIAGSMLLARERASADPSPTAALSNQLCSVLAMNSPLHPSQQQQMPVQAGYFSEQQQPQQQLSSYADQEAPQLPQQQQQQPHNQGAYIPRTDDLVTDPLMDMLMDQAIEGGMKGSRPGTSCGQQQQGQQRMSIMEATLQQQQPPKQQQYYRNVLPQQQYSLQQPQQVARSMPIPIKQGQQQDQLAQLSSLLQYFPLPPKSEAEKPAWQEHMRQVLSSLQLQPQQQQQLMTLIREREQQALLARWSGAGCTGSNDCSPVLPASSSSMHPATAQPQQQQQHVAVMSGAGVSAGCAPRMPGMCMQQFGGKPRLGPSRLSASSPAIEPATAAMGATGADAGGMQVMMGGYMAPDGLTQPQYMAPAAANAMLLPTGSMGMQPMSAPVVMPASVSGTAVSAGYALQLVNGSVAALSYGCGPQMMPLPMSMTMDMQPSMGQLQPMLQQQPQQQQQVQAQSNCTSTAAPPVTASPLVATSAVQPPAALTSSDPAAAAATAAPPAKAPAGGLLADLQQQRAACSSPLKRSSPSGPFGLAPGFVESDEAMSPLKRACRDLPEPPSFATLLQAELGEDDAVAWAASAAANDSLRVAAALGSCGSFLKFDSLSKFESGSGSLAAFVTVGGSEAAAVQMAGGGAEGVLPDQDKEEKDEGVDGQDLQDALMDEAGDDAAGGAPQVPDAVAVLAAINVAGAGAGGHATGGA